MAIFSLIVVYINIIIIVIFNVRIIIRSNMYIQKYRAATWLTKSFN